MPSTGQAGPQIVTNGIVLYLDAGNKVSYPGSGNKWYDLTPNANNFTLINSPVNDGVGFTFNGTSQYAECVNNTFGNFGSGSFTLEYTFNLNATQATYAQVISKRNSNVSIAVVNEPGFYYNPGGLGGVFTVLDNIKAPFNDGNWYLGNPAPKSAISHVAHVVNTNGITATVSSYHNGVFNQSMTHTYPGTGIIDNVLFCRLMAGHSPFNYTTGILYIVRAYNYAFSTSEILQNYNFTKYRYRL